MSEHTPTPWHIDGNIGPNHYIEDADKTQHAAFIGNSADAELVIRAVNAHEELVYRCQVLYRELGDGPEEIGDVGLLALRAGIAEMFERIGMPGAEKGDQSMTRLERIDGVHPPMAPEATPRPWAVCDKTEILTIADLDLPGVGDVGIIADTHLTNDAPRDIDIANAEHIVLCVNAFDVFVAALEQIEREHQSCQSYMDNCPAELAKAALAKARGES